MFEEKKKKLIQIAGESLLFRTFSSDWQVFERQVTRMTEETPTAHRMLDYLIGLFTEMNSEMEGEKNILRKVFTTQ